MVGGNPGGPDTSDLDLKPIGALGGACAGGGNGGGCDGTEPDRKPTGGAGGSGANTSEEISVLARDPCGNTAD